MRACLRRGRAYELHGRDAALTLEPSDGAGYRHGKHALVLEVTRELAEEIDARLGPGLAGTYRFGPWLQIVVTPSPVDDPGGPPPDHARIGAALAMTARALRLAPDDPDVQFTHAMLLLDAEGAGMDGKAAELLEALPRFAPSVRINVAVRMGEHGHARFAEAVDLVLGESAARRRTSCSASSARRSSRTRRRSWRAWCRCCRTTSACSRSSRGSRSRRASETARSRSTIACSRCRSPTMATIARTTCAR